MLVSDSIVVRFIIQNKPFWGVVTAGFDWRFVCCALLFCRLPPKNIGLAFVYDLVSQVV